MLADTFSEIFRNEHRQVRDVLLDLMAAFRRKDQPLIRTLLEKTAHLTGPHFRYEEQALYPVLNEFFGESYVESLLQDHDRAIGFAHKLIALSQQDTLTTEDAGLGVSLVRSILPHVSECDGLSIIVERLPESKVQAILDARDSSNHAGLNLIEWAATSRRRPAGETAVN